MNYKIRITAENQAIVKRIADENNMADFNIRFTIGNEYVIQKGVFPALCDYKVTNSELTTEQFIQLFDKKETELDKWLKETKAKSLSRWQLQNEIDLIMDKGVLMQLQGSNNYTKAQILFNQWNNPTEESPKIETEWKPKRGDRVLVWDDEDDPIERIFLAKIEGAKNPIVVVNGDYKNEFENNEPFDSSQYEYMKPLPIEPKETDFKSKFEAVIELIEKNINDKQEKLKFVIDKNNLIYEAVLECIVEIQKDLLKQIKEL